MCDEFLIKPSPFLSKLILYQQWFIREKEAQYRPYKNDDGFASVMEVLMGCCGERTKEGRAEEEQEHM